MTRTTIDPRSLLDRVVAYLPDFELERELGRGGMGVVLLGRQRSLNRDVAVKLLFAQDVSEQLISRFRREAKLYATLAHPNLVKIYDAGVDAELPYLVLEYIRGQDLKAAILSDDPPELRDVALPLASALAYIHGRGIVHRDIKSLNVMMRDGGSPVLMDFGLAKRADPNATALTEDGIKVGTPYYMPPEVLMGRGESGMEADVYALGLVLYEVAVAKTMGELDEMGHGPVQRIQRGLPPIAEIGTDEKPEMTALVEACLVADPAARPTAVELVERLQELCGTLDGAKMPVPERKAGLKTIGQGQERPAAAKRERAPTPRRISMPVKSLAPASPPRERATLALAALTLVIGAGVAYTVWSATRPVPAQPPVAAPFDGKGNTKPSPASPVALPARRTAKDGQQLILVKAGFFTMGANFPAFPDEKPVHRVYLDAYYIAEKEVTNALYDRFCAETKRAPRERYTGASPDFDKPDHPVVGVTWFDAVDYAKWAGQRLPTEAEWERAARGTDARRFPWGNDGPGRLRLANFADSSATAEIFGEDLGKAAKFQGNDGYVYTAPVGSYPQGVSPVGALDMAGNVQEWVNDWYDAGSYASAPPRNPPGPASGSLKILRGGSWDNIERSIRTVKREHVAPATRSNRQGFRTAQDV